jgi:hypothetical protein
VIKKSGRRTMMEKKHASSGPTGEINRNPEPGVVETRLRSYLSRDSTGIRREVLRLFIHAGSLSIAELIAILRVRFTVTFQAIASMVGMIASRIGILSSTRTHGCAHTYGLKEKYAGIVVKIVGID